MFLQALSENTAMKESIRKANQCSMPIYAECGGFMYLCEHIHDFDGNVFDTVGVVPANLCNATKTAKGRICNGNG